MEHSGFMLLEFRESVLQSVLMQAGWLREVSWHQAGWV
jgi:hypothetical protein